MLKSIPPIIGPDLLRILRAMGHGDEIAIVDANYPADSAGPEIVRMDGLWVMFYFGAFWKPGAFDTFAVSRDLVHWTKWTGPDLVAPSEPWDGEYAHKPWLVRHNGVVYHFYCAVDKKDNRGIAVATSVDKGKSKLNFK